MNIVFLISFGRYILQVWTKGKVEIDYFFFVLMLISLLPNTFYVTSSYVQVAINKLGKIALLSLGTSAIFLTVSYIALPVFGIRAIPVIQSIIDSVLLIIIVRDSLKLVQDRIPAFILSMFAFPHIKKLIKSTKVITEPS
ncbi:MAG TPA: hypothetical protein VGO09_03185 [Flavisolibacter sp.]|nr:hypothetical protein [Flavisolibacter sp.]